MIFTHGFGFPDLVDAPLATAKAFIFSHHRCRRGLRLNQSKGFSHLLLAVLVASSWSAFVAGNKIRAIGKRLNVM